MIEGTKCRHDKPHYECCDQCGAEYRHMVQYRARIKQTEDDLVARAQTFGVSQTIIGDDGCEITATPAGHVFYNMSDWF